jgi:hypothetical protein
MSGPGVLIPDTEDIPVRPISGAFLRDTLLTLKYPDGTDEILSIDLNQLSTDNKTGRLTFVSPDGIKYNVREFRENDGRWMSKYRISLPEEALSYLTPQNEGADVVRLTGNDLTAPDESLDAFSIDDSVYILGLVYTNQYGRFSRVDGDWVLLAPNDRTYDDMIVTSIDPNRAEEFLDLYDRNYVTVTDAEEFELSVDDNKASE